jgi:hypothetical protein
MHLDLFATTLIHTEVVHDWTFKIGNLPFGIREANLSGFFSDRPPDVSTAIFLGPTTIQTSLPAWECLSIAAAAAICLVAAVSVVIARCGWRQSS